MCALRASLASLPRHKLDEDLGPRVLRIAEESGATLAPPIYTLGPLIHNPSVVARLAARGIAAIDALDQVPHGTVIVRTHGVDPDVELDLKPDGLIHSHDVQLDYAIDYLERQIAQDPRDLPKAPPIRPRPLQPVK